MIERYILVPEEQQGTAEEGEKRDAIAQAGAP